MTGPRAGINANDGFGGGDEISHNLVFSSCRESGDHGADPTSPWLQPPTCAMHTATTFAPVFAPESAPQTSPHAMSFNVVCRPLQQLGPPAVPHHRGPRHALHGHGLAGNSPQLLHRQLLAASAWHGWHSLFRVEWCWCVCFSLPSLSVYLSVSLCVYVRVCVRVCVSMSVFLWNYVVVCVRTWLREVMRGCVGPAGERGQR